MICESAIAEWVRYELIADHASILNATLITERYIRMTATKNAKIEGVNFMVETTLLSSNYFTQDSRG